MARLVCWSTANRSRRWRTRSASCWPTPSACGAWAKQVGGGSRFFITGAARQKSWIAYSKALLRRDPLWILLSLPKDHHERVPLMRLLAVHQGGGLGGAPVSLLKLLSRLDFETEAIFTEPGSLLEFARELNVPATVV